MMSNLPKMFFVKNKNKKPKKKREKTKIENIFLGSLNSPLSK